jgi:hypothetical protein
VAEQAENEEEVEEAAASSAETQPTSSMETQPASVEMQARETTREAGVAGVAAKSNKPQEACCRQKVGTAVRTAVRKAAVEEEECRSRDGYGGVHVYARDHIRRRKRRAGRRRTEEGTPRVWERPKAAGTMRDGEQAGR